MGDISYSLLESYDTLIKVGQCLEDYVNAEENYMTLKVNFKNGSSKDFRIDGYYVADNDICLYMEKNGMQVGMINLCEVRYYFIEDLDD